MASIQEEDVPMRTVEALMDDIDKEPVSTMPRQKVRQVHAQARKIIEGLGLPITSVNLNKELKRINHDIVAIQKEVKINEDAETVKLLLKNKEDLEKLRLQAELDLLRTTYENTPLGRGQKSQPLPQSSRGHFEQGEGEEEGNKRAFIEPSRELVVHVEGAQPTTHPNALGSLKKSFREKRLRKERKKSSSFMGFDQYHKVQTSKQSVGKGEETG